MKSNNSNFLRRKLTWFFLLFMIAKTTWLRDEFCIDHSKSFPDINYWRMNLKVSITHLVGDVDSRKNIKTRDVVEFLEPKGEWSSKTRILYRRKIPYFSYFFWLLKLLSWVMHKTFQEFSRLEFLRSEFKTFDKTLGW